MVVPICFSWYVSGGGKVKRRIGRKASKPDGGPAASFKPVISGLMAKWSIPGGAVALVKDGRLVLAEGYGLAGRHGDDHGPGP